MCGIAGIISLNKYIQNIDLIDKGLLSLMLKRIKHRGPDGEGLYIDNDFCIGSVRLNIIGGKKGQQPVQRNRNALVFNGEIYNFRELSRENEFEISDTKVLFDLLSTKGIEVLNQLNGMFAFCFADLENIYLVRDRFGEKPLFYTVQNNKLYFSSEIKSFIEVTKLQLSLPTYYPLLETSLGSDTIFKGIYQIKPGHFLKISRNEKTIQEVKYYTPSILDSKLEFNEAKLYLRKVLDDAIKIRIPQRMNFAAYVSGGLDSSIIALSSHPHALFSIVAKGKTETNEEKYADILADALQVKYVKLHAMPADFVLYLYNLICILDGPTTSLAAFSQFMLSKEAHEEGYKVALSGIGADEFLNGYVRHVIAISDKFTPEFSCYKELYNKVIDINGPVSRYGKLLNRSSTNTSLRIKKLIEPLFVDINTSGGISLSDSICTLPPLLSMDDHINMAFAIENRSPFLDHRVVEFALSLSDSYKIMMREDKIFLKHILKKSYENLLPNVICERRDKVGFPSQVNEWLSHELAYLVKKSQELLREVFPRERYFFVNNTNSYYDRRNYQWVQLAATYLIYSECYNNEEFQNFFRKTI